MKLSKESSRTIEEIYLTIGLGKFHVFLIITLGLIHFFDAVEIILLSFLGPILSCSWRTSLWETSLITFSVFMSMLIGSLLFGKLSDVYGRKTVIMVCVSGIFYFSLICAAVPTIIWMIVIRFTIGLFIGGVISVLYTYISELMSINYRGLAIVTTQIFWPFGGLYVSLLTYFVVNSYGWRLWLIVTVCPMIVLFPLTMWLPESPRYLIVKNKLKDAIAVINRIASWNNAEKVSSIATIQSKSVSPFDMFHSSYIRTTCIIMCIFFVGGSSYYSLVLISTIITSISQRCLLDITVIFNSNASSNVSIDNSCCLSQTPETIKTASLSVIGEIIFYIVTIFVIKYLKRKLFLQILLFINAVCFLFMNVCLPSIGTGVLMMIGRGSTNVLCCIIGLYTSEVFPTTIRGISLGFGYCFLRTGAMSSSFIVNVAMVEGSFIGGAMFYFSINVLGFLLIFILPYETKGRPLMQSVDESVPEMNTSSND